MSATPHPDALSVGIWNLKEGGFDAGDPRRAREQLDLLEARDPVDVWMLQETTGWDRDGNAMLHEAATRLRMHARFLIPSNHDHCHLTMLVRERPGLSVLSEAHDRAAPWWHARGHLNLSVTGRPLTLMNLHLAPSAPVQRLTEAQALAVFRKWPVIAGGDLNALSHEDTRTPTDHDPEHTHRKMDPAPAHAMQNSGFRDVGAHLNNTTPTVGFRRPDTLPYRCDRIISTLHPDAFDHYEVLKTNPALSDHRPVIATFNIKAAAPHPA